MKISDDKCSISETSSHIHNTQDCLHFCVYGIKEPGKDIKEDLVKLMKKKLDNTTLDIINQSLSRNLKCRLSPQDVEVSLNCDKSFSLSNCPVNDIII